MGPGNTDNMDAEAEGDADGDAEGDNDDDNEDDDDDEPDQEGSQDSFGGSNTQGNRTAATSQHSLLGSKATQPSSINGSVASSGPTSHPAIHSTASHANSKLVRPEALTAPVYDIVPTIAAPHSTSINAITATPDLRWVFSGGTDGYIRKFNWVETANGKSMLTVAQKHPFVDSVTKAGVLMSYWENEDSQRKLFARIKVGCHPNGLGSKIIPRRRWTSDILSVLVGSP